MVNVSRAMNRPYILLTNDDGVDSLGLLALKQTLQEVGEVVVIAPDHNWSAAGHTKTMHKPLRVEEVKLADGSLAYASNGAPSDCVALGVLGFLERKPDLVVSGINEGPNLGHDITYSGTVAAAMEGVIAGIPSIAVSLADYEVGLESEAFSYAAQFTARLAKSVLAEGLRGDLLLNVNVPNLPREEIRGVGITRLGKRIYKDVLIKRQDPRGRTYYWIGGEPPTGVAEEGTDIWAIVEKRISITPIKLDLTEHGLIERLRGWRLEV